MEFDDIFKNLRKQAYKCIGVGSGRQVYALNNGYVVKLAKNRKGLAQNKAEFNIFNSDRSNMFAYILKMSDDYRMLIMEKAEKVNNISEVWNYFNVKSNKELRHSNELKQIAKDHDVLLRDLCRAANWGKIGSKLVIIDYGFTKDVKKKYY